MLFTEGLPAPHAAPARRGGMRAPSAGGADQPPAQRDGGLLRPFLVAQPEGVDDAARRPVDADRGLLIQPQPVAVNLEAGGSEHMPGDRGFDTRRRRPRGSAMSMEDGTRRALWSSRACYLHLCWASNISTTREILSFHDPCHGSSASRGRAALTFAARLRRTAGTWRALPTLGAGGELALLLILPSHSARSERLRPHRQPKASLASAQAPSVDPFQTFLAAAVQLQDASGRDGSTLFWSIYRYRERTCIWCAGRVMMGRSCDDRC